MLLFGRLPLSPQARAELSRALNLGLNCAAGMAVFSFAGYWLDQRRGGEGRQLCTLIGMVLGLAYGAYEVWKVVRDLNRQAADACRERSLKTGAGADEAPPPPDN